MRGGADRSMELLEAGICVSLRIIDVRNQNHFQPQGGARNINSINILLPGSGYILF